jgi:hypothetical protein
MKLDAFFYQEHCRNKQFIVVFVENNLPFLFSTDASV